MTRLVLRMIGVVVLSCLCIVLLALGIGHMLPPEDEIIFSSYHGYGIYWMSLTRGLIEPLIKTKTSVTQPDWSPDGYHIAFVDNQSAQLTLYIADVNGRNKQLVTNRPNSSDYDPKWSPDGRFIAYSTSSNENTNGRVIEVMLLDTETHLKRQLITTNIFREHMLSWSPDGSQIAFVLYPPERGNSDIFSINIQSGDIHSLVSTSDDDEYPVWSPDGRYLAYMGGKSQRGIYLLDTSSGKSSLLYTLSGVVYPSDWSEDGHFIFISFAYNIYKLEVSTCLKNPNLCTPELLMSGGGDARRKPRTP